MFRFYLGNIIEGDTPLLMFQPEDPYTCISRNLKYMDINETNYTRKTRTLTCDFDIYRTGFSNEFCDHIGMVNILTKVSQKSFHPEWTRNVNGQTDR